MIFISKGQKNSFSRKRGIQALTPLTSSDPHKSGSGDLKSLVDLMARSGQRLFSTQGQFKAMIIR